MQKCSDYVGMGTRATGIVGNEGAHILASKGANKSPRPDRQWKELTSSLRNWTPQVMAREPVKSSSRAEARDSATQTVTLRGQKRSRTASSSSVDSRGSDDVIKSKKQRLNTRYAFLFNEDQTSQLQSIAQEYQSGRTPLNVQIIQNRKNHVSLRLRRSFSSHIKKQPRVQRRRGSRVQVSE